MPPQEVLNHLQTQPFRPFRIRMNSGRIFDIRHPDSGRQADLLIVTFVSDSSNVYDRWENVPLLRIQSSSPWESSAA